MRRVRLLRYGIGLLRRAKQFAGAVKREFTNPLFMPPGHYYSPVATAADRHRATRDRQLSAAVNINEDEQLALIRNLTLSVPRSHRWVDDNDLFNAPEAALYRALLLQHRPRRVIEIGSGYSTALALDVAETDLPDLKITCIEPFPTRLRRLLRPEDSARLTLFEQPLHQVDISALVSELEPGDVFFVDSTHVVKPASDVLQILLHVLPALPEGVLVHFHDIYWPFEYPDAWLAEGRDWNEAYFLHAFLAYNDQFRIFLFQHFLHIEHAGLLPAHLSPGSSLWMVKADSRRT